MAVKSVNSGQGRDELHRMVDTLPEDKIEAAGELLKFLLVESGELPLKMSGRWLSLLDVDRRLPPGRRPCR